MKIAVLCGGLSNERDVSLSGGAGIARALRRLGHRVALLDLFLGYTDTYTDPEDVFTSTDSGDQMMVAENAPDLDAVRALRPGQGLVGPRVLELCKAADITFLALHGEEGENGKLQAFFDINGVRYTGSGYLGSALAMNKSLSKALLRDAGVPVAESITINRGDKTDISLPFPCVVKPCSGGSSVGTTIVRSAEEYDAALQLAFRYEDSVLAESFISGRELTVGVLDGKAMPVTEIIPLSGFYDYKNKYQPGMTDEPCPAPITAEQTAAIQALAEKVYKTLHLQAYGRVDFIMGTDGVFYCLEANTLPGMTPTSLIPRMGAAMGLDYGQLCQKLIDASMKNISYEKLNAKYYTSSYRRRGQQTSAGYGAYRHHNRQSGRGAGRAFRRHSRRPGGRPRLHSPGGGEGSGLRAVQPVRGRTRAPDQGQGRACGPAVYRGVLPRPV